MTLIVRVREIEGIDWIFGIGGILLVILCCLAGYKFAKDIKNTKYTQEVAVLTNMEFQSVGTGGIYGGSKEYTIFEIDGTRKIKIQGTYNQFVIGKPIVVMYKSLNGDKWAYDVTQ
jgi:hypothetical protein